MIAENTPSSATSGIGQGLRHDSLSFSEVLAQSVANIAPTATPGIVIPLVFASAGAGTWLAYLAATVGLLLVSWNINQFARRSASVGSLYVYVGQGLGSGWGVVAGWSLVLAYLFTAAAVLLGFVNYAEVVLGHAGLWVSLALAAVGTLGAWYIAYRDVQLSTKLMLFLELVSVSLILILAGLILARHGFRLDHAQIALHTITPAGLRLGLVLAVFSFVGFESATALGGEARDPHRTIPRAVIGSVAAVGLFFIVMSYVEVIGFQGHATTLDKSAAPLNDLARFLGLSLFGRLLSAGAAVSFFACTLASLNAGARILFAMSRHGIFHRRVGDAHRHNETPHVAVGVTAVFVLLVPTILLLRLSHSDPTLLLDAYGWLGTIATFGFLLDYVLVSIAAPAFLRRRGEMRPHHAALAAVAVAFLLVPIVGSVSPLPPPPGNLLPFLFLGLLGLGLARLLILRVRAPQVIQQIGHDLEQTPPATP